VTAIRPSCLPVTWLPPNHGPNPTLVQGASVTSDSLGGVVLSLREMFKVEYIYCWHGLPAYWSGVSVEPEVDPDVAKYNAQLKFVKGTPGGSLTPYSRLSTRTLR
jgi:Raffinose synthase or seed imbibition protein Sip1